MPRNPTERQIEASRRNGARSRGPVTALGRQRAALNAFKHGRYSRFPCLTDADDEAAFSVFREAYYVTFQPANDAEIQLVDSIAAADWRINRLTAVESRSIDIEDCRQLSSLFPGQDEAPALDRLTASIASLVERSPLLRQLSLTVSRLAAQRATYLRQLNLQRRQNLTTQMPFQALPGLADEKTEFSSEPENEGQLNPDQSITGVDTPQFEPENPTPLAPASGGGPPGGLT